MAEVGISELQKHVDSLIVILNDRLMDVLGEDVSMDEAFRAADNVLRNAVGGIAEIINFPGLVNVDFEDVRTVMGEMGMAMMGSANAAGVDRARIAAERAVSSPLLEGVNLSGAKGVLVNITASRSLKMKEVNEVMNTVRAFAADDAHIIFGAVYDEQMGEEIRVTVVATGLGQAQAKQRPFEVIRNVDRQATGTDGPFGAGSIDYASLDQVPAIVRKGRSATVEALANSGVDRYDIPAFLRKQAD
ncbi:MAG: Cell division protein FtsZ [Candidatus Accumulibacter sp. BA-94]|nr:MAG: Cell division protein FtsZ [Candidatus Accumulibacter sp. BA-94]